MNNQHWQRRIIWAVSRSAAGEPARLRDLAQQLEDATIAREALICAGFGTDGDTLGDLVAVVVERESLRDEEIIGLG